MIQLNFNPCIKSKRSTRNVFVSYIQRRIKAILKISFPKFERSLSTSEYLSNLIYCSSKVEIGIVGNQPGFLPF